MAISSHEKIAIVFRGLLFTLNIKLSYCYNLRLFVDSGIEYYSTDNRANQPDN